MRSQTVRRVAPLAAGAAVLAVVAASALLLRDDGAAPGSTDLPLLRIGAGVAAADVAAGNVPGKGRVIVSTPLPAGPDSARVYRFGPGQADAGRLAAALGVEPGQVRSGDAVAADQGTVLRVGTGRGTPWQFARADAYRCLDALAGEDADGAVSSTCAAPPQSSRPGPDSAPSDAEAIAAAGPVLDALGLSVGDAEVDPANRPGGAAGARTVRVDPDVDDAPTTGFATSVTVDPAGILTASGWLGEPRASDRYPVIGADAAVDLLAAMPVPLIACPDSTMTVPPGPSCGGPIEVTGARFGRSVQWEGSGRRAVLVPSWLFDVKGAGEPLTVVAVDPAYLADPLPPDPGDGTSGSGGAVPGSPGTVDPGSPVEPVAPAVEPTAATSRFESVVQVDGGAALRVTFYGGVESCYSYDVVATESADQVSLLLVEKRSGQTCIDLAQEYERTVRLARPLGSRSVFDAATGSTIIAGR